MKLYDKAEKTLLENYNINLLEEIVLAREDRAVYYVEFKKENIYFNKIHGKSPMDHIDNGNHFTFDIVESLFDMNSKYGEVAGKQYYKDKNIGLIKNMKNETNVTIPLLIQNRRYWVRFHLYKTKFIKDQETMIASCYITDVSKYLVHEEKLYEKTHKDELTGLFNRYALYYHFELHGDRTPIASYYFDIDNFKNYNDVYGHDVGDEVLVKLASNLKELANERFKCYRLGGDEFYCLLYETSQKEMREYDELLHDAISKVQVRKIHETLTISVGALYTEGSIIHKYNAYMKEADSLMYVSKKNGKKMTTYGEFYLFN